MKGLIVEFTKMNGAGNDFIVIDNRFYHFSIAELSQIALQQCPRRTGIGADGVLALASPESSDADYRMIYINADGSEGTMCGNGARCLAKFAYEGGILKRQVSMQTASGSCMVSIPEEGPVRIYVDPPKNYDRSLRLETQLPDAIDSVHYLWPGTQHLVCLTNNVVKFKVDTWGPIFRHDPALAPEGANINFVELDSSDSSIKVRTYEKGVEAETLACGTGAVASTFVAHAVGLIKGHVCHVKMKGGTLTVGLEEDRVYLEGPATSVYRGSFLRIPTA
ncbi:MAG: diaminopimelate epimerase [Bacteroidetes bacterium]|nr:diaminopimelate epimerase [Bacteroidota bacterium]